MSSSDSTSTSTSAITKYNSEDIVKKKQEDQMVQNHLGEIKDTSHDYVISEKGVIDKDRFYIPKNSIIHLDG